jgi:hypothetical protein
MKQARTFDAKSYDLAAAFLSDEPELNTEAAKLTLACVIQHERCRTKSSSCTR